MIFHVYSVLSEPPSISRFLVHNTLVSFGDDIVVIAAAFYTEKLHLQLWISIRVVI